LKRPLNSPHQSEIEPHGCCWAERICNQHHAHDLPEDFAVAHGLTVTPDEKSVFVASYISSYIAKIDTATDTVTKVWGPHGGFVAGSNR